MIIAGEGDMEITSAGFQFLLLNQTEQIWMYILHYLRLEESMGKNVMAELDFLLKYAFISCVVAQSSVKLNKL